MKIQGITKDLNLNQNDILVTITNNNVNGNDIDILPHSDVMFGTQLAINSDLETIDENPFVTKSFNFSLITKKYLGDYLFATNPRDVSVEVKKNNVVVFLGYLTLGSYNQPYASDLTELTLQAVDELALLQYSKYSDASTWQECNASTHIESFLDILCKALQTTPSHILYDKSKTTEDGNSILTSIGISTKFLLGDDETSEQTFDLVVSEILRLFNLHIEKRGSKFYIFSWDSFKGNTIKWYNAETLVEEEELSQIYSSYNIYSDTSTNISLDRVFNKIQVTDTFEEIKNVFEDPLRDLEAVNKIPIKYLTEIHTSYDAESSKKSDAYLAFDILRHNLLVNALGSDAAYIDKGNSRFQLLDSKYAKQYTRDWYMLLKKSAGWQCKIPKNGDIENIIDEVGASGYQFDERYALQYLKSHSGAAAFISFGSTPRTSTNPNADYLQTFPDMKDYLVIAVNGNGNYKFNDTEHSTNYSPTDEELKQRAENYVVTYDSNTNVNYGKDKFLVFSGKLQYQPLTPKTGRTKDERLDTNYFDMRDTLDKRADSKGMDWLRNIGNIAYSANTNFSVLQSKYAVRPNLLVWRTEYLKDGIIYSPCWDSTTFGDGTKYGYYQNVFWNNNLMDGRGVYLDPYELVMTPPLGNDNLRYLPYDTNAQIYDGEDLVKSLPVLWCRLNIGTKHLVEVEENKYLWVDKSDIITDYKYMEVDDEPWDLSEHASDEWVSNKIQEMKTTASNRTSGYTTIDKCIIYHKEVVEMETTVVDDNLSSVRPVYKNYFKVCQIGFNLGFNPQPNDYIIGQEHELTNNIDMELGIEGQGTAIPLHDTDGTQGNLHFEIVGAVQQYWHTQHFVKRHSTWFRPHRHSINQQDYIPILTFVSNILISSFECKIVGKNSIYDNSDGDIVFISDTNEQAIETKELDCKLNSHLTEGELENLQSSQGVNIGSIVNVYTKELVSNVKRGDDIAHPEQLICDELYSAFSKPTLILNTLVHSKDDCDSIVFDNNQFDSTKRFYVYKKEYNLLDDTINLGMREDLDYVTEERPIEYKSLRVGQTSEGLDEMRNKSVYLYNSDSVLDVRSGYIVPSGIIGVIRKRFTAFDISSFGTLTKGTEITFSDFSFSTRRRYITDDGVGFYPYELPDGYHWEYRVDFASKMYDYDKDNLGIGYSVPLNGEGSTKHILTQDVDCVGMYIVGRIVSNNGLSVQEYYRSLFGNNNVQYIAPTCYVTMSVGNAPDTTTPDTTTTPDNGVEGNIPDTDEL